MNCNFRTVSTAIVFFIIHAATARTAAATSTTTRKASGNGRVFSFTHVHVSFYGSQWESQLPYTPVLVDLDEGVRMLSRLVGPDREQVTIGDQCDCQFCGDRRSEATVFSTRLVAPHKKLLGGRQMQITRRQAIAGAAG